MKIVSESPLSVAAVKERIDSIKKRDAEPNFRVTRMEDYLAFFPAQSIAKAQELLKNLEALNVPRLREPHIYKILELLPRSVDDLKILLQGFTITISNENAKKIVDVVNDVVKPK